MKKPLPLGYPEHPQTIGEHVRKKRMEEGLFQEDVARLFKISVDTITNWENNKGFPQIRYLPTILSFLKYNPFAESCGGKLGERIKLYRMNHGLSHKKFGKLFNVDAATVSTWETGSHAPQKRVVGRLYQLLNAPA